MFSKYQLPLLAFSFKGNVIWFTILLLLSAFTVAAQNLPKKPTLQQLAGYHNQQQQNWQQKQLPQSSISYKFSTNFKQSLTKDFSMLHSPAPVAVNYPLRASAIEMLQTTPTPFLQTFLLEERRQYLQWQKQSWWRDPSKLKGAELLRDLYISNRRN